jgi:hypothetical protein
MGAVVEHRPVLAALVVEVQDEVAARIVEALDEGAGEVEDHTGIAALEGLGDEVRSAVVLPAPVVPKAMTWFCSRSSGKGTVAIS